MRELGVSTEQLLMVPENRIGAGRPLVERVLGG